MKIMRKLFNYLLVLIVVSCFFLQPASAKIVCYTNGDQYEGGWKKKAPHGFGTMNFADGSIYKGMWEYGKKQGSGTYSIKVNGGIICIEGEWSCDSLSIGTITDGGNTFRGSSSKDFHFLRGKLVLQDGSYLEGILEGGNSINSLTEYKIIDGTTNTESMRNVLSGVIANGMLVEGKKVSPSVYEEGKFSSDGKILNGYIARFDSGKYHYGKIDNGVFSGHMHLDSNGFYMSQFEADFDAGNLISASGYLRIASSYLDSKTADQENENYNGVIYSEFCNYQDYLSNNDIWGNLKKGMTEDEWWEEVTRRTGNMPVNLTGKWSKSKETSRDNSLKKAMSSYDDFVKYRTNTYNKITDDSNMEPFTVSCNNSSLKIAFNNHPEWTFEFNGTGDIDELFNDIEIARTRIKKELLALCEAYYDEWHEYKFNVTLPLKEYYPPIEILFDVHPIVVEVNLCFMPDAQLRYGVNAYIDKDRITENDLDRGYLLQQNGIAERTSVETKNYTYQVKDEKILFDKYVLVINEQEKTATIYDRDIVVTLLGEKVE